MLAIALGVPFVDLILRISPSNPMSQIANAHIAFNVITAAILLPFGNSIVSLSKKVLHGMNGKPDERGLIYLDKHILETPPIAIAQILKEVNRMADLAVENVRLAMDAFFQREQAIIDEVYKKEEIINFLNQEITHYLVMCNGLGLPESDLHVISGLYHVVNDIERIGDHAENLTEYAEYSIENNLTFSDIAIDDLNEMYQKVMEMLDDTVHALKERDHELAELVMKEEEVIDTLKDRLRKSHIERLNAQLCSANAGVIFLDIVTNFERIADHATNVAQSVLDEGRTRNY